jgi:uncharacterized protein YacL
MRRALMSIMAWIILTACLAAPVMQAFDRWDHELQTGHDTEFIFVVVGLCIGAVIVVARAVLLVKVIPARAISAVRSLVLTSVNGVSPATFLSASPPSSVLRI